MIHQMDSSFPIYHPYGIGGECNFSIDRGELNAVWLLVERFDTEFNPDFSAKSPNFRGLALFCIEADFCTQIRIFQHFSRSTRFSHFCTAFICKIRFKHRSKFCKNCTFFVNFHYFCSKSTFFAPILMNFSRNFTDFQYSRVDIR